jgi:hypothetical protein
MTYKKNFVLNESRQPTPEQRPVACLTSLARSGCVQRYA